MTALYLVRHGEVHNPRGIIYGRLPGFGLSERGRAQVAGAAALLEGEGPFAALYTSPLQRARESAAILGARLGLEPVVDERIVETDIGTFQGRRFEELPRPYIAEQGAHSEIEAAASMRTRFLVWAGEVQRAHPGGRVAAVSHRDPIGVALLYWQGRGLEELPGMALEPGSVHAVLLEGGAPRVRALQS